MRHDFNLQYLSENKIREKQTQNLMSKITYTVNKYYSVCPMLYT